MRFRAVAQGDQVLGGRWCCLAPSRSCSVRTATCSAGGRAGSPASSSPSQSVAIRRRMFASNVTESAAIPASRRVPPGLCLTASASSAALRTSARTSTFPAPAKVSST